MSNLTLVRDNTHIGDSAELPHPKPVEDVPVDEASPDADS